MFDDALHFLVQAQEDPDWARLGQHLPYEWIEQALAYTGKASIRKRRLPAEQVVWLVVALVVDGIDGPLARKYDVKTNFPLFDGVLLDLIIDYLTYVFIPAFALFEFGLLPGWT